MSHATKAAFDAWLRADTKSATLTAGSTTEMLQLGAGEAAAWAENEIFNVSASGSASHNRVRRITAVDTTLDQLSISPALPAAPAFGSVIGAGVLQWVASAAAIRYRRPAFTSPAADLLDSEEQHGCALLFGEWPDDTIAFSAKDEKWLFLAIGRNSTWCQGLAARIARQLHGNGASLSITAQVLSSMRVTSVGASERDDPLYEWQVTLECVVAEEVA